MVRPSFRNAVDDGRETVMARNARNVVTFSTVVGGVIESLRKEFKTARSTTVTYVNDDVGDEGFDVAYHSTVVARVRYEGDRVVSCVLTTNGFRTATTKTRMNDVLQAVGLPVRVYQQDHAWFMVQGAAQNAVKFDDGVDAARVFGTLT